MCTQTNKKHRVFRMSTLSVGYCFVLSRAHALHAVLPIIVADADPLTGYHWSASATMSDVGPTHCSVVQQTLSRQALSQECARYRIDVK